MSNPIPIPLEKLQTICKRVEKEMLEFLLQFGPVGVLTVNDVNTIAQAARNKAFKSFDDEFGRGH
jgi:hypothetical protein